MQRPSASSSTHAPSSVASFFTALGFGKATAIVPPIASPKKPTARSSADSVTSPTWETYDPSKEHIKAYLRIRPPPSAAHAAPYVKVESSEAVEFVSPDQGTTAKYRFTRVFEDTTTQSELFEETALPMVKDVLNGNSGLLFAYGVSNSGKTHTTHGTDANPGILPRIMDVLFNSTAGKVRPGCPLRPTGVNSVEVTPSSQAYKSNIRSLGIDPDRLTPSAVQDNTVLPTSGDFAYSIWVSYAEIYNDKIYDLLFDEHSSSVQLHSNPNTSFGSNPPAVGLGIASSFRNPSSASSATLKRKALSLKQDKQSGKYVAGLHEVRVFDATEAKAVLHRGQLNRRVFSTLLNRTSSRSHGILQIRIVRAYKHAPLTDTSAAAVSRLCIVDLAGSERTANTGTTGERLKEAGSINKSLMVLGQCMETLRRNQEVSKKKAVVPFRHSKLTEIFQSFFANNGKAVMIVNINPYDTGYDENNHVMRFSAVAKQIKTTRAPVAPMPELRYKPSVVEIGAQSCDVTIEEVEADSDEEDEQEDELVRYLFEENRALSEELRETKIKMGMLETDIREAVMKECEAKIREMEEVANARVAATLRAADMKMDMKIDILNKAYAQQLAILEEDSSELSELSDSDAEAQVEVDITPANSSSQRYPLIEQTPANGRNIAVKPNPQRRITRSISGGPSNLKLKTTPKTRPDVVPGTLDDVEMRPPPAKAVKATTSIASLKSKSSKSAVKPVIEAEDESLVLQQPKKKKMKLVQNKKTYDDMRDFEQDASFVASTARSSLRSQASKASLRP